MINISKKLLLISCLFMVPVISAKKAKKTKHLQLLVVPSDPSYIFALNAGDGIDSDPGAIRPQGSYYVTNAFIFPGGTIDKKQLNYSVDKHGRPINLDKSLGMVDFLETMLQTLDFNNVPANGTTIEMSEWFFHFKPSCNGANNLYAMGLAKIGIIPPQVGKPIYKVSLAVTGASGCNLDEKKNSFKAKVYLPQNNLSLAYVPLSNVMVVALIEIEFEEEIEYKK